MVATATVVWNDAPFKDAFFLYVTSKDEMKTPFNNAATPLQTIDALDVLTTTVCFVGNKVQPFLYLYTADRVLTCVNLMGKENGSSTYIFQVNQMDWAVQQGQPAPAGRIKQSTLNFPKSRPSKQRITYVPVYFAEDLSPFINKHAVTPMAWFKLADQDTTGVVKDSTKPTLKLAATSNGHQTNQ